MDLLENSPWCCSDIVRGKDGCYSISILLRCVVQHYYTNDCLAQYCYTGGCWDDWFSIDMLKCVIQYCYNDDCWYDWFSIDMLIVEMVYSDDWLRCMLQYLYIDVSFIIFYTDTYWYAWQMIDWCWYVVVIASVYLYLCWCLWWSSTTYDLKFSTNMLMMLLIVEVFTYYLCRWWCFNIHILKLQMMMA